MSLAKRMLEHPDYAVKLHPDIAMQQQVHVPWLCVVALSIHAGHRSLRSICHCRVLKDSCTGIEFPLLNDFSGVMQRCVGLGESCWLETQVCVCRRSLRHHVWFFSRQESAWTGVLVLSPADFRVRNPNPRWLVHINVHLLHALTIFQATVENDSTAICMLQKTDNLIIVHMVFWASRSEEEVIFLCWALRLRWIFYCNVCVPGAVRKGAELEVRQHILRLATTWWMLIVRYYISASWAGIGFKALCTLEYWANLEWFQLRVVWRMHSFVENSRWYRTHNCTIIAQLWYRALIYCIPCWSDDLICCLPMCVAGFKRERGGMDLKDVDPLCDALMDGAFPKAMHMVFAREVLANKHT